MKQKILLHACCAPCTAGVYYQLIDEFDVTLFWYNPNIFPKVEHDRRLNELLNFCDSQNIRAFIGDYDWSEEHAFWLESVKGLEKEPEKGKRCGICYKVRLEATAAIAAQANDHHPKTFDYFGAELSISPHKDAEVINRIGKKIAEDSGIKYYLADFKKNDGYKKGCQISKELKLYRQNYCGCEFSQPSGK
ncbi:recombinase [Candidatus Berkelbacteria bacterium CG08_land_8_20_14_0_20_39_8]|uniref:Epoxyqueuosine reductase QueH n=1 Tax=Candidatus Berkelbacteria bacterium CG08_land_8_20_14_0_20_39_8 TaxID=1974511 RepID=A0A2M6YBP2_9BACT|nr:MAG: recombinase [Candidatus Berkelbacteria bacterium CG08_land_8_20_14_0_20_39_8]